MDREEEEYSMSDSEREKMMAAAARLEQLTIAAKQIVQDIRDDATGSTTWSSYARMYWLRKEMGKVTASLGVGVPPGVSRLAERYEQMIIVLLWEPGCCDDCGGTGRSGDPETGGRCWTCRGTGHPHVCTCAGGEDNGDGTGKTKRWRLNMAAKMVDEVRGWVALHKAEEVTLEQIQQDLPHVSDSMIQYTMRKLAGEGRVEAIRRGRMWSVKGRRTPPRKAHEEGAQKIRERAALSRGEPSKASSEKDPQQPDSFTLIGFTTGGGVLLRDNWLNMWIARRM